MDSQGTSFSENEMLKALYDFQAIYPKTISFDEGEYFILHQTSARQRNWWQVVSMKGNIGFVPSNYVMKLKVEPEFLVGFLDSSIESLKLSTDEEVNGIINRMELIQRLEERKKRAFLALKKSPEVNNHLPGESTHSSVMMQKVERHDAKSAITKKSLSSPAVGVQPPPQPIQESPSLGVLAAKLDDVSISEPSETTHTTTSDSEITTISKGEENSQKIVSPPSAFNNRNATVPTHNGGPEDAQNHLDDVDVDKRGFSEVNRITSDDVYLIVDSIRLNTNLSHTDSCIALRTVLTEVGTLLPHIAPQLETVASHLNSEPLVAPDNLLGDTHDSRRLRAIFADLADCKNDSEQRSWMLFEDEDEIIQYLTVLNGILKNADPKICCYEMSCDHYQSIINLVQYYQMETRWTIRRLLLDAFKAICQLDYTAVDVLLGSVLPTELIQDMTSNSSNVERLKELAMMMTMIFSIGLKMPVTHEEHFGKDFLLFVLNIIECPPATDINEILPDVMINLVLSFNLQFDHFANSVVLDAFREMRSAKTFTEKLLMLINRETDPVRMLKHTTPFVNSVLKMIVDLFGAPETASLFYSNDNKVLIDILVRQLSDLSPEDPLRRWYLELCRRILRNTDYPDHTHRKQDLMKIFTRIFCEEAESSLKDQQLVREIANEFPQIFKA
ncbi:NCK-interacting protein with SH3 domain [Phlebotomus argentipes]|uniref:NCK-interacting protein with SH3 domain n=1 Tax=Phlebotomus argentipes TaxID=94469 RepID=UPI002892D2CA|nr:NCK-interacting protein with SH3 domain [Phlebotomus argentipes]